MTVREVAYPPAGASVRIPDYLWEAALAAMRTYAKLGNEARRRGSEALVYFGGAVSGDELLVTSLYKLNHTAQGDRVVVTPDQARWLLRSLRARDEKLIGQMHSHRGAAGHSPGDDLHATSFHEGFLSVVVPRFAAGTLTPGQCAVLEFRAGRFTELSREAIEGRVKVYRQIAEPISDEQVVAREEGRWAAFARRLRSIGPRPR